jgi:hypothetical protein
MERRCGRRVGSCPGSSAQSRGVSQHLSAALARVLYRTSHMKPSLAPAAMNRSLFRLPHLLTSYRDSHIMKGIRPSEGPEPAYSCCRRSTAGRMLRWWPALGTWAFRPPSLAPCKKAAPTLLKYGPHQHLLSIVYNSALQI